jgi:hypothetical protein
MEVLLVIVKMEVVQAGCEPHMMLVKDGRPLHRSAVQFLARQAVTNLRILGIGANLISNTPAKAGGPVFGDKRLVV